MKFRLLDMTKSITEGRVEKIGQRTGNFLKDNNP